MNSLVHLFGKYLIGCVETCEIHMWYTLYRKHRSVMRRKTAVVILRVTITVLSRDILVRK